MNYDEYKVPNVNQFSPGTIKIQIGVGQVLAGQSFDQWLSAWIATETAPLPGSSGPALAASQPQSYKVGNYNGFKFTINSNPTITEVDVPTSDGRVIILGLVPSDSAAFPQALSVLSSIEILPKP